MRPIDHVCCPVSVRRKSRRLATLRSNLQVVALYSTNAYSQTFVEVECAFTNENNPFLLDPSTGGSGLEICQGSCRQNVTSQLAVTIRRNFLHLEAVEVSRGCNFVCANPDNCLSNL